MTRPLRTCLLLLFSLLPTLLPAQGDAPSRRDLSSAERYVELFERQAKRANGAAFRLGYEAKQALKIVRKLKEQHSGHAKVEELFERTRRALLASKGQGMQITPEMLAYREKGKKLRELFAQAADEEWQKFETEVLAQGKPLRKAFPVPSHRETDSAELAGRYVVLDDFRYPERQFSDGGRSWVAVGSGGEGYWFVDLGGREWLAAYEALRRYRRFVHEIPQGEPWTLIGRVAGVELLVPQAGKQKTGDRTMGLARRPRGDPCARPQLHSSRCIASGGRQLRWRGCGWRRSRGRSTRSAKCLRT